MRKDMDLNVKNSFAYTIISLLNEANVWLTIAYSLMRQFLSHLSVVDRVKALF